MLILLMGFELGKSSLEKLLHPEQLSFSWLAIAILAVSIGMKIWMFHFNRVLGEAISSQAMKATAADSLSDAVATAVVLAAALEEGVVDETPPSIARAYYMVNGVADQLLQGSGTWPSDPGGSSAELL